MTTKKENELLARIDERSINTYNLMEKLEKHQAEQNNSIQETLLRTKTNRILIGIGGSIFALIIAWLASLQGLW